MTLRFSSLTLVGAAMSALTMVTACSRSSEPAPPAAAPAQTLSQTLTQTVSPTVAPTLSPTGAPDVPQVSGVAWTTGDVDAAFAAAKAEHNPVFLYWGAVWCP